MAKQAVDNFSKNLNPVIKHAIGDASKAMTETRLKTFSTAYPEEGKLENLRNLANKIKSGSIADRLEKAVERLEANGVKVLFAKDADEANRLALDIIQKKNAKKVVKAKSMTTEETELNHYLEKNGIEIVETDLGEFIIQLNNEKPSHIVKPAMHLRRQEIAKTFESFKVSAYNDDPKAITLSARKFLRDKYIKADVAITGANFVLAEEGAIVIATNEGNSRFSMAGAKTHIAIAGIEKVIPSARELAVFINLLARSATGQHSTIYTEFVSGAGSAKNSPEEMFLIFLDNGRSQIAGGEFAEILKCIRCGACMNRCPVFRLIGGHGYRATYPGPLGIVLSPLFARAADNFQAYADLPKACSLCGACAEECPSKIPLPDLIVKMRNLAKKEKLHVPNDVNLKPWAWFATSPKLWKFSLPFSKLGNLMPLGLIKFGPLWRWTKTRTLPKFKGGNFRKWSKNG